MAVEYKMECYWSQHSGWNFSFGKKQLWEVRVEDKIAYKVADYVSGMMLNHNVFDHLEDALDYMRTGKR